MHDTVAHVMKDLVDATHHLSILIFLIFCQWTSQLLGDIFARSFDDKQRRFVQLQKFVLHAIKEHEEIESARIHSSADQMCIESLCLNFKSDVTHDSKTRILYEHCDERLRDTVGFILVIITTLLFLRRGDQIDGKQLIDRLGPWRVVLDVVNCCKANVHYLVAYAQYSRYLRDIFFHRETRSS